MITGAHAIVYSSDAGATRAFFRDILGFPSVDAGDGWLIFALPPSELAAHPVESGDGGRHELYFMCDDIHRTVKDLRSKGVEFTGEPVDQGWGILTSFKVPGGGEIGLYEPRHPRPSPARAKRSRGRAAGSTKRRRTRARAPAKGRARRRRR